MYARALPQLQAERQLHMVNAVKLGFADSSDSEVRSHLRDLEFAASGGRRAPAAKPVVTDGAIAFGGFRIPVETLD